MAEVVQAKKGRVEVGRSNTTVNLALARDDGRIYSRPGAGWVDLTPAAAREIAGALTRAAEFAEAEERGALVVPHTPPSWATS